ncbi:Xanthine phosphoribosyltransferase 1 [Orbilia brochopaga]|uniref:Xanthine phosphoribosyltransferase 1 n=1 Tax=Orbilia brochopaga TaxID=3140254 RepID=A0AAV9UL94_9PEZI
MIMRPSSSLDAQSPRPAAYPLHHFLLNTFIYTVRRATRLLQGRLNKFRNLWTQASTTRSLPLFQYRSAGLSERRRRNLLTLSSLCCISLIYSFSGVATKLINLADPPLDARWDRDQLVALVGSQYFLGELISTHEWSTFAFGSKAIPAPPPEPPGAVVIEVVPPSDWLTCPAAQELVRSLPEVTFISFEEALSGVRDLDNRDLGWLDEWLSEGALKYSSVKPIAPVLDVVYTWVNGSSRAFHQAKHAVESTSRLADMPDYRKDTLNRHQDWDELRYSLRSIETFLAKTGDGQMRSPNPLGNITNVSTAHSDDTQSLQIPLWLDTSLPDAPRVIAQESLVNPVLMETCALDTFSSCSIEARLDRLESDTDKFMSLSDDMLLSDQHSPADIYSPLYGFSFAFEYSWPHFTIDYPPAFGSEEYKYGELPYLYLSAYLLQIRFGWEYRSYPKHTVHPMSRSILRELRSTFPSAFELSSAQRFRGESPAIHLWFLFYWYVIERHRETLLWSYLYGNLHDGDTGMLNKTRLLLQLSDIDTSAPFARTSLLPSTVAQAFANASIEPNKASQGLWTSLDGPVWLSLEDERELAERFDRNLTAKTSFQEPRYLKPCRMEPQCFEFEDTSSNLVPIMSIFDRWRRVERSCGDCMINILLRKSGPTGLGAFLARDPKKRKIALRALHRYSHTISRVDARYGMMESSQVVDELTAEWLKQKPAEICFNDHLNSEDPVEISKFAQKAKGTSSDYQRDLENCMIRA